MQTNETDGLCHGLVGQVALGNPVHAWTDRYDPHKAKSERIASQSISAGMNNLIGLVQVILEHSVSGAIDPPPDSCDFGVVLANRRPQCTDSALKTITTVAPDQRTGHTHVNELVSFQHEGNEPNRSFTWYCCTRVV